MMNLILLGVVALVWAVGACLRLYRQMRFFQIEEYKNLRYLRWWLAQRARWLPMRGTVAGIAGLIVAAVVGDTVWVTAAILLIAAAVGAYPEPLGEVKKAFVATPRARRIIGTGFVLIVGLNVLAVWGLYNSGISSDWALWIVAASGFALWWLVPPLLVVANGIMAPVEAFVRWRFYRMAQAKLRAVKPVVIGITGSYGKTSTKTYLAHLLNGRYRAFPTPKSWNTLMGVCRAINNDMARDAEYFICEMGAYVRGEIQGISRLTHPTIGIITEIGPQHLERFGSLENIAIAKYELIKALPADGVAVFNWDNPHLREMIGRGHPQTILTVSRSEDASTFTAQHPRFVASAVQETLEGLAFTVTDRQSGQNADFACGLYGIHNVNNLLIAVAVCVQSGMSLNELAIRIRTLQPAESRLVRSVQPNGLTIINDAYSANPVGAVGALRVLGLHTGGRRLLITPGMIELGELHAVENRKLGQIAAQYATDVILVGAAQTRPIYEGLQAAGFPPDRLQVMETVSEAIAWYQAELKGGDTVLFLNDLPDTYNSLATPQRSK
ncbi:MAG: Mur ligase family protein [Phototrophicaceae bacterium]